MVQVDRRANSIRDEAGVFEKFGVGPSLIPDFLALVGDLADGYPGIKGIGRMSAARMLNSYGPIEDFPEDALGKRREDALLFKRLATLRTDAETFADLEELHWHGANEDFAAFAEKISDQKLLQRAEATHSKPKA